MVAIKKIDRERAIFIVLNKTNRSGEVIEYSTCQNRENV